MEENPITLRVQEEMDKFDTLEKIVKQLEWSPYECEGGFLKNNVAFLKLKEMSQDNSKEIQRILWDFYNYVMDEHDGNLHEEQIGLYIEYFKAEKEGK